MLGCTESRVVTGAQEMREAAYNACLSTFCVIDEDDN